MARNNDMSKKRSTSSMHGLNRLNPSGNTDKKSLDGIQKLRPPVKPQDDGKKK